MEAVVFIGIQASGKSTFYKNNFYRSHIRINLDMLKNRKREDILLEACIRAKQPFVVDNTNPTVDSRSKYIEMAKQASFKIVGYYFDTVLEECLDRNEKRPKDEYIPPTAIRAAYNKLQPPVYSDGFDELYTVKIKGDSFEKDDCSFIKDVCVFEIEKLLSNKE